MFEIYSVWSTLIHDNGILFMAVLGQISKHSVIFQAILFGKFLFLFEVSFSPNEKLNTWMLRVGRAGALNCYLSLLFLHYLLSFRTI